MLCAKPQNWFDFFLRIKTTILPPKVTVQTDLAKLPEAITEKPGIKSG